LGNRSAEADVSGCKDVGAVIDIRSPEGLGPYRLPATVEHLGRGDITATDSIQVIAKGQGRGAQRRGEGPGDL